MQKTPYTNDYRYIPGQENSNNVDSLGTFNYAVAGIQLKYARTQYYPFLGQHIPIKDNYPVIHFNYFRGFDNFLGGEYAFNKVDFQLQKRYKLRLAPGQFTLRAGFVDQPVPYTEQFFANGSKTGSFSLFIGNSFVTMPLNEFLTDRYASLHLTQQLFRLGNENFYLKAMGHGSAGWGDLSNPRQHSIPFQSMERGYYESGITLRFPFLIDNLEWVVGSFYRLGSYQQPNWQDNLAIVYSAEFKFQ
jgi:hypothetical protein